MNPEEIKKEMTKSEWQRLHLNEWLVLKDGEPCDHVGCLSHVSHPREGCGRVAGVNMAEDLRVQMDLAKSKAERMGRRVEVFLRNDGTFDYIFGYTPRWLFRAYPGGRTIVSVIGRKILNAAGEK